LDFTTSAIVTVKVGGAKSHNPQQPSLDFTFVATIASKVGGRQIIGPTVL